MRTNYRLYDDDGKPKTDREFRQERMARILVIGWFVVTSLGFAHDALCADKLGKLMVRTPKARVLKVIYKAAKRFNLDAQALIKIAYLESSFREDATRVNPNGTVDYGMFQVNSVHWTTTCKDYNVFTTYGNTYCAAKLLWLASKHSSHDPHWTGRYHSKTPSLKAAYADKLASIELKGE